MNCKRTSSSRSRNRSRGSSPRPLTKNSRTKGSKVSLNSVSLSEKDDVDTSGMDSDDELGSSSKPFPMHPSQAWAAFENSIKNIDNGNPDVFIKKPKPSFLSSGTFQKVMVDMFGNTEYGNTKGYTIFKNKLSKMGQARNVASSMFASAIAKGEENRENEELLDKQDDIIHGSVPSAKDKPEVTAKVTKTFGRALTLFKREVNEKVMETKTQSKKLNWTMIQHTVKQMSNVEKTRQDLYERYGIVPTVQEDGSIKRENRMLSERARAQLYTRKDTDENRRPMSYQPPPTHLRPESSYSGFNKKNRNSAKIPNVRRYKPRPVTAIR